VADVVMRGNTPYYRNGDYGYDDRLIAQRDQYGRYLLPDPEEEPEAYEPMPPDNKQTALMIHLPVGSAKCKLFEIDIKAGIVAAGYASWVRNWRKRNDLSWPLIPAPFSGNGSPENPVETDDW